MEMNWEIIAEGSGTPLGWHDPDEHRAWVRANKNRSMVDKRMTVTQAVNQFVTDGSLIAVGGFGHISIPMVVIYEIVRQRKRDLSMCGKTSVHDIDILIGGGCISRVEVAYAFGHELRGLSPVGRRAVENGQVEVVGEISNAAFQWRFMAAAMGIPFIISRNMLGTDTFEKSCAKAVCDPWSGKTVCLLPACYPDVVLLHVPRCDKYGNAQIDGILNEDFELARAARRVIISTENVIDEEEIRRNPRCTTIPYYLVDAVIDMPWGAHPTQMPYTYYFDEEHICEWLNLSKTEQGTIEYFERYVYGTSDFEAYLDMVGGVRKLNFLRKKELFRVPAGSDRNGGNSERA